MPRTPNGRYAMASHSRAWEEFHAEELEDYFEEPEPDLEVVIEVDTSGFENAMRRTQRVIVGVEDEDEDDEDWADAQVVRWP